MISRHCECGETTFSSELFLVKAAWCPLTVSPNASRDWVCSEAIKKENPKTVPCDAVEIDIYLQQEASSLVLPSRCKKDDTPRKSYYALLALCVVRNLVFAGPQLERGDQNERQSSQQWWRQSLWLFRAIEAGSCRPASSFPLLAVSIGHTFWVELFEASVEREKSSAVSPVVCAMPQQVQDKAKGKRWKWRGHCMWFDYLIASCSFFLARSWGWEVSVLLMPSLRRVRNP